MKYATKKEINKRLYLPEDSRFVQEVIETANVKTDYPEDTTGMKNIKLVDLDSFSEALMEPVHLTRWVRKFLPDIRLLSRKGFSEFTGLSYGGFLQNAINSDDGESFTDFDCRRFINPFSKEVRNKYLNSPVIRQTVIDKLFPEIMNVQNDENKTLWIDFLDFNQGSILIIPYEKLGIFQFVISSKYSLYVITENSFFWGSGVSFNQSGEPIVLLSTSQTEVDRIIDVLISRGMAAEINLNDFSISGGKLDGLFPDLIKLMIDGDIDVLRAVVKFLLHFEELDEEKSFPDTSQLQEERLMSIIQNRIDHDVDYSYKQYFATSDYYLTFWLLNQYLTNRKTEDDGTMEVSYDDIMFMQALVKNKKY